jgi:hypothetical protein
LRALLDFDSDFLRDLLERIRRSMSLVKIGAGHSNAHECQHSHKPSSQASGGNAH